MTYEEALDVLVNEIHIDCASAVDFKRHFECLRVCKIALEKRISKKPMVYADSYYLAQEVWEEHCPVCGYDFDGNHLNSCPYCGQAIDWSNTDD